jgi:hypothetical protein
MFFYTEDGSGSKPRKQAQGTVRAWYCFAQHAFRVGIRTYDVFWNVGNSTGYPRRQYSLINPRGGVLEYLHRSLQIVRGDEMGTQCPGV